MATEQEAAEASARVFAEAFMKVLRERLRINAIKTSFYDPMTGRQQETIMLQLEEYDPVSGTYKSFLAMPQQRLVIKSDPWGKVYLDVVS